MVWPSTGVTIRGTMRRYVNVVYKVGLVLLLCTIAACSPAPRSPEATILSATVPAYDYPIQDPYAATVIAMPPEQKLDLSDIAIPDEETITIFPDRELPDGYWYEDGLRYGQLLQDEAAPLIYVIAGTGGDHRGAKMHALAQMFYSAGFHVVLLPSPTHQNFIINASSDFLGERPLESAKDLYRAMKRIDMEVAKKATITDRMLTGYSLGAMDAAFTAYLDDQEQQLHFKRVLLINPPYDLNNSTRLIDRMLYIGMPGGMDDADRFIERLMARLGSVSQGGEALDFENERLLLDAYEQDKLSSSNFATTIGLSFRLSAANMVFASDIMSKRGYIFPKDAEFTRSTDLDTVMAIALRTSFVDYADAFYNEQLLTHRRDSTREQLAHEDTLAYLENYIRGNPKFALVTNQDDIILAPGEIDTLAALFGEQARIFSNGGHLGNMTHPAVAYAIVHFMQHGGRP